MAEEERPASDANTESASFAAYQQMQCGMMRLSQELRDKIYTDVFAQLHSVVTDIWIRTT